MFLELLEKVRQPLIRNLKTLAGICPRFLLSAVEQAFATCAEKRQNVEIKPYYCQ